MTRNLQPRPVPAPEIINVGQERSGIGKYLLQPSADCIVRKPSWNGKRTVIRPYPCVHHANPNDFWPYRIDPEGRCYFGYWLKRFDCAWAVGNPGVTFLIQHDPRYSSVYDVWSTPLGVLYSAIARACRAGQGKQEWYPLLLSGGAGRRKLLRPPSECCLIQGALMEYDSKQTFGPGRAPLGYGTNPPVVMVLSAGLAKQLIEALHLENENYRGDPADFEARFVHGDPVGLANGRFFHFVQKGYENEPVVGPRTGGAPWDQSRPGPANKDDIGFDLKITKEYANLTANMLSPDVVRDRWRHWEDVLYTPNYEEQARILSSAFPASAILYAFQDYPDWITEDVRRKDVNAVSVGFDGTQWRQDKGQPLPPSLSAPASSAAASFPRQAVVDDLNPFSPKAGPSDALREIETDEVVPSVPDAEAAPEDNPFPPSSEPQPENQDGRKVLRDHLERLKAMLASKQAAK